ncbi:doublesex- and mab-3-related transcription factor B1 [Alligator mississippiensis]|uniref:Doublesex- and mab-3-related transcription factor B1 n=1 Tax=Alligator mississippiensis TaxID=8496 RepID=A0A151M4D6_ALLMI|nr:doublesex- and mab-3-related transcription factor B1 [Alligator mississippiensis]
MVTRRALDAPGSQPFGDFAYPALPPECLVSPEFLEREPPKVYPGYSGMYPYHPFPMGFAINQPSCRGVPASAGIPLHRGYRHAPSSHIPASAASLSIPDAGGDFRQGYYAPLPQFIPPGFLPGIHYIPSPPFPLGVLPEASKDAAAAFPDSQESGAICECSQPSSQEETDGDHTVLKWELDLYTELTGSEQIRHQKSCRTGLLCSPVDSHFPRIMSSIEAMAEGRSSFAC